MKNIKERSLGDIMADNNKLINTFFDSAHKFVAKMKETDKKLKTLRK